MGWGYVGEGWRRLVGVEFARSPEGEICGGGSGAVGGRGAAEGDGDRE